MKLGEVFQPALSPPGQVPQPSGPPGLILLALSPPFDYGKLVSTFDVRKDGDESALAKAVSWIASATIPVRTILAVRKLLESALVIVGCKCNLFEIV